MWDVRPTNNPTAVTATYCDGLGYTVIDLFENQRGIDGVRFGHSAFYYLEFTRNLGQAAGCVPTEENFQVFYIPIKPAGTVQSSTFVATGTSLASGFHR